MNMLRHAGQGGVVKHQRAGQRDPQPLTELSRKFNSRQGVKAPYRQVIAPCNSSV